MERRFVLRVTASVTEASGNLERIMTQALSARPLGGLTHQLNRGPGALAGMSNMTTLMLEPEAPSYLLLIAACVATLL